MADDFQVINVEGVGPVRFPNTMSDDDITSAVRKLYADANPQSPTAARVQSETAPGKYVREMVSNVPGDLLEQGKGVVTGTFGLLSKLAGATAEGGQNVGAFIRETVGLQPHYVEAKNARELAAIPGVIWDHYKQNYGDSDQRAMRIRDNPVGAVLDVLPVAGALKGARAGARATVNAAKANPDKAAAVAGGVAGGMISGPGGIVPGAFGAGAVRRGAQVITDALKKKADEPPAAASGGRSGRSSTPAAQKPRLTDPRVEQSIRQDLGTSIDSIRRPEAAVDSTRINQMIAERLRNAAESPARAGATTEFMRPNPNAGGNLVPAVEGMADDLGAQLDLIQRRPSVPDIDPAQINLTTAERLREAAASPARANATTEFTRPKPEPPKNTSMAEGMKAQGQQGRRSYDDKVANERLKGGMSDAGRAANPNAGGRVAPSQQVDEGVREALGDMRGERTGAPLEAPPDLPRVVERRTQDAMEHLREVLRRQELNKAERATKTGEPPKAEGPKAEGPKAEPPAPPEPTQIGKSKSKKPTYTENDLKAAKEKWGSTDIAELRAKYGQAVDDYLLEQRRLRHQQHYNTAKEQAAARRTDLGGEGQTSEQLRMALLEQQKRRGK